MKNHPNSEPKLAPPGAGIPFFQKIMLRVYLLPFVVSKISWEASEQNFHKVYGKILKEVEGLTETEFQTKILVPPQSGLEDSSRYWSVKMTLEHLMIVGKQIFQLIPSLCEGIAPNQQANIALYKPTDKIPLEQVLSDFKKFIGPEFAAMHLKLKNKNSKTKFAHPWFGKMTAKDWYWLLPAHGGIHLKQIREIKKGLALKS